MVEHLGGNLMGFQIDDYEVLVLVEIGATTRVIIIKVFLFRK